MTTGEHPQDLAPLIDDAGDPGLRQALQDHVDTCPACRAALAAEREAVSLVRLNATRHRAPPGLAAGLAAIPAPEEIPRPAGQMIHARPRPWRFGAGPGWRAMAASIAVVALVSAGGTHLLDRNAADADRLGAELVTSHIRSLEATHLYDVESTDQHTVKPWFDGKLDYAPPVVDLKSDGFPLVGGRLDYVGRHVVAALVYQRARHVINLFVWPTGDEPEPLGAPAARQGYNVEHWTAGGMSFWAVSDVNPADLHTFSTDFEHASQ